MSRQNFLDNVVWLWEKIKSYGIVDCFPLLYKLEQWYEIYFRQIYGGGIKFFENSSLPSIYTYYQSWLLRGDNPNFNQNNKKKSTLIYQS